MLGNTLNYVQGFGKQMEGSSEAMNDEKYTAREKNTNTEAYRATLGRISSAHPNATQGNRGPCVCLGRQWVA